LIASLLELDPLYDSVGESVAVITDPSKSKLGKKTERRVTFAELVRTATGKTENTMISGIAINGSQIFITVPSTSGPSKPNINFHNGRP
jgi:hypothetical protein